MKYKYEFIPDVIVMDDNDKKRKLKVKSKVRSIHSSLAIEANSLSLESVKNIVDNKIWFDKERDCEVYYRQKIVNGEIL